LYAGLQNLASLLGFPHALAASFGAEKSRFEHVWFENPGVVIHKSLSIFALPVKKGSKKVKNFQSKNIGPTIHLAILSQIVTHTKL